MMKLCKYHKRTFLNGEIIDSICLLKNVGILVDGSTCKDCKDNSNIQHIEKPVLKGISLLEMIKVNKNHEMKNDSCLICYNNDMTEKKMIFISDVQEELDVLVCKKCGNIQMNFKKQIIDISDNNTGDYCV